jgi:hypothetical protein
MEVVDKKALFNVGQKTTNVLTEMKEGSSFGDLALMHNIKRTATVVCKGRCTVICEKLPDCSYQIWLCHLWSFL